MTGTARSTGKRERELRASTRRPSPDDPLGGAFTVTERNTGSAGRQSPLTLGRPSRIEP